MHFRRALSLAKGHIGRAYGHAVRFGSGFDKGIGFALRSYHAISPVMRQLGGDTSVADKSAKHLGNSYDSLRSQVSKVHDAAKKIGGI